MKTANLLWIIASLACGHAAAADVVLASVESGTCVLTLEASERQQVLMVRIRSPKSESCDTSEETLPRLLTAGLSRLNDANGATTYSSISIGRLVRYPWLSVKLVQAASADKAWDAKRARAMDGNDNRFVSALLARNDISAPLLSALAQAGYKLSGISVEKVLVGGPRDIPNYAGPGFEGRMPFDAQVWLRVVKK
jgi:hypothetical protein